jgi:hypothetical protein
VDTKLELHAPKLQKKKLLRSAAQSLSSSTSPAQSSCRPSLAGSGMLTFLLQSLALVGVDNIIILVCYWL